MESYISISYLNDFMFCPRSIYFHQLYGRVSTDLYHTTDQSKGLAAHKTVDNQSYTTSATVLQGIDIYSEQYGLCGKIDIYDKEKSLLVERKKKIKRVYDGYIFQLYAQYHCLIEMNYEVEKIKLYSMDDNKSYPINTPDNDPGRQQGFERLLSHIKSFSLEATYVPNHNKCGHCIYHNLCDLKTC